MANIDSIKKLRDLTQAGMMDSKKALEENGGDIEKAVQWLREKGIAKAAKKADAVASEGVVKILIQEDRAIIVEINSQTDFVANNEKFNELADDITLTILEGGEYDLEKALKLPTATGLSVDDACKEMTGRLGEKIVVRRFTILLKDANHSFASYIHTNGKIGVLLKFDSIIPESVGKDIAMHAAAMAPKFLDQNSIDKSWLENEAKILKEQTIAEGKPADRAEMIVKGRVNKLLSEVTLINQQFVKDPSITINEYLKRNNGNCISYIRYEVGEGIEKKVVDFAAEVASQMNK